MLPGLVLIRVSIRVSWASSCSRMGSKRSRFTLGVWGVERCSPDVAFTFATVRNHSQPSATVRVRAVWPVPIGSSAKGVTFGAFQRRVASFRVAGMALRGIPTCFKTCQKSFCVAGANTFATFSEDVLRFFVAGRSTLDTSDLILRGRRSPLDVWCCVFSANPQCQRCAKWWQGANSVAGVAFCDMSWKTDGSHSLHFTLYTLHSHFTLHTFKLHTLHSTLHTSHSTLYTLHPHTLHCTLYTPHFTPHTLHLTLHILHITLSTPHFTLHTLHSTLRTFHSTLYTSHFTLHTLHFALHNFTLYTPHFTFHTLHFTPHTLHSTIYTLKTLHFTLHT